MVAVVPEVLMLVLPRPPASTEQFTAPNCQSAGIGVSLTVYVVNAVMPPNVLVFAAVPSSTSEKLMRGAGLAVNGNEVDPFGVASLMIVMDPGKITASAESERSWAPPLLSRSTNAV